MTTGYLSMKALYDKNRREFGKAAMEAFNAMTFVAKDLVIDGKEYPDLNKALEKLDVAVIAQHLLDNGFDAEKLWKNIEGNASKVKIL